MDNPLIRLVDLSVKYFSFSNYINAVTDINLEVYPGETLGIVGESGSGKSTVGWAILNMIEKPNIVTGSLIYDGMGEIFGLSEWRLANYRWKKIAMVFQASMNSFDPLQTIRKSFIQLLIEKGLATNKEDATKIIKDSFSELNLSPSVLERFPHELSGGMKQRIIIAMATTCEPEVLIADEPTTALDVVSQFNVINILKDLIKLKKIKSMIFITHDISVQLIMADRLVVMYGGRIVEIGKKAEIIEDPKHPYTKILFKSFVKEETKRILNPSVYRESELTEKGQAGCPFIKLCDYVSPPCYESFPKPVDLSATHRVYCYIYGG